jgi:type IV fimbrial biogenesis protein FimT
MEEIASELRLARQLAITRRDRVRVVFDHERQTLVAQFVNDTTIHHTYRYGDKGIVVEESSGGSEILFHPSGRSATATTIQLRGKEGLVQKLTVGLTGRVSIL